MIDSGLQCKIEKLEKIQDRILRTFEYVYDMDKRENIEILKARYSIENLETRRKRNLLKVMFNESHNVENIDSYRPNLTLRSRDKIKLKTKFTRITKIQKSPFYRGVSLWDSLPKELQQEQSRMMFKKVVNGYKFG